MRPEFAQLAQLGNGAHALAIQILGNAEDAADAVHDSFATVLSRPGAYDADKGPLKPWFFRVVRNRCLDMVRRRRDSTDQVSDVADPSPGPEQRLANAQRSSRRAAALAALSCEKREIIVLRDFLDLSYADISQVLSIAPGTVMSRIHRARTELKEVLGNYEE